jgi:hypothetical protein
VSRGNSTELVERLLRFSGTRLWDPTVARTLARCPRHRLVRAVAWYAHTWGARVNRTLHLPGLRYVIRGWDDVYTSITIPAGSARANVEAPPHRAALVIRPARIGRGWQKDPLPSLGLVRPEIELATAWLEELAGCILHEDCVAVPALGRECFNSSRALAR